MEPSGKLREPLLSGEAAEASAGAAAAARSPPAAWAEFTDPNGRGLAVLTGFLLGVS